MRKLIALAAVALTLASASGAANWFWHSGPPTHGWHSFSDGH